MHIILKNKFLYFGHYKIKCAIGKRGISKNKKEGDLCTPVGKFIFEYLMYRKDRNKNFKTHIPKKIIKKNMGWCDDSSSKKYNKLIKFPFPYRAEKLFLRKRSYDLLLVMNYNRHDAIPNKGSAIFLHVADRKFTPTKGCVAIKKKDFLKILPMIGKKTKIIIS
tara:strand:- start:2023 stop:2514 length:492 start_codon:yes stop_codon:yes gene_type:complete